MGTGAQKPAPIDGGPAGRLRLVGAGRPPVSGQRMNESRPWLVAGGWRLPTGPGPGRAQIGRRCCPPVRHVRSCDTTLVVLTVTAARGTSQTRSLPHLRAGAQKTGPLPLRPFHRSGRHLWCPPRGTEKCGSGWLPRRGRVACTSWQRTFTSQWYTHPPALTADKEEWCVTADPVLLGYFYFVQTDSFHKTVRWGNRG